MRNAPLFLVEALKRWDSGDRDAFNIFADRDLTEFEEARAKQQDDADDIDPDETSNGSTTV